jgi:predicted  nucleic acid-binding Zn-ribbon protein
MTPARLDALAAEIDQWEHVATQASCAPSWFAERRELIRLAKLGLEYETTPFMVLVIRAQWAEKAQEELAKANERISELESELSEAQDAIYDAENEVQSLKYELQDAKEAKG